MTEWNRMVPDWIKEAWQFSLFGFLVLGTMTSVVWVSSLFE
jgi:hypothetical protein